MTTSTKNCTQNIGQHFDNTQNGLYQMLHRLLETQRVKKAVKRERKQLLSLSNAMLNDMGISREEAVKEANRLDLPVSRLPKC